MKSPIHMTNSEWDVMTVVWQRAPVPASTVFEELLATHNWSLATVRTLLRRLVNKGAVAQQFDGRRHIYSPRVSMEACVHRESESFWDRVLGRAPSSALIHLVKKADLSKGDIAELRRILKNKEK